MQHLNGKRFSNFIRLAVGVLLPIIILGGAFLYANQHPKCDHCGLNVKTADHEYVCPICNYQWNCQTRNSHHHCTKCKVTFKDMSTHTKMCDFCGFTYLVCQKHICPTGWSYKRSDPTSEKQQSKKMTPFATTPRPINDNTNTDR